jgi:hypothetical protein
MVCHMVGSRLQQHLSSFKRPACFCELKDGQARQARLIPAFSLGPSMASLSHIGASQRSQAPQSKCASKPRADLASCNGHASSFLRGMAWPK